MEAGLGASRRVIMHVTCACNTPDVMVMWYVTSCHGFQDRVPYAITLNFPVQWGVIVDFGLRSSAQCLEDGGFSTSLLEKRFQ